MEIQNINKVFNKEQMGKEEFKLISEFAYISS